jgi:hypothetical protein
MNCDLHRSHYAGCEPCRTRSRKERRQRLQAIADGTHRGMQDPAPVRKHLRTLIDGHGMSCQRIAAEAGLGKDTVLKALHGESKTLTYGTTEKLLAVRPTGGRTWVSGLGVARMLQALSALGRNTVTLAADLDVSASLVSRWRRQEQPEISTDRDRQIRDLYRRLMRSLEDGKADDGWTCAKTRKIARTSGWAPPLAWDSDADLDDPDAVPDFTVIVDPASDVVAGRMPVAVLNMDERVRVVEYFTLQGWPDQRIADHLQWQGGRQVLATYRSRNGIPCGSVRGRPVDEVAIARRKAAFARLSEDARASRIERYDFAGEPSLTVAKVVGCVSSTVDRHRAAKVAEDADTYVDEVAVEDALAGRRPFEVLNEAEKIRTLRKAAGKVRTLELCKLLQITPGTYSYWQRKIAALEEAA